MSAASSSSSLAPDGTCGQTTELSLPLRIPGFLLSEVNAVCAFVHHSRARRLDFASH